MGANVSQPKKKQEISRSACMKHVSTQDALHRAFGPLVDHLSTVLRPFSHDLIALIARYCVWGVASVGRTPNLLSSFETTLQNLQADVKGMCCGPDSSLWVALHHGSIRARKFSVVEFDTAVKQTKQIDIGRSFNAIAVDRGSEELFVAVDNMILVFGCEDGVFRRNIGKQHKLGLVVGIAVDHKGLVFAADRKYDKIYVFERDGAFVRKFGDAGAEPKELFSPDQIAVAHNGELCVHDQGSRLQFFSPAGVFLRLVDFSSRQTRETEHFAFDRAGNLAVRCWKGERECVRVFDKDNKVICEINKPGALFSIAGLCVDDENKILVVGKSDSDKICVFSYVFAV